MTLHVAGYKVRVTFYSQVTLIVTLIAVSTMNKGIEAIYEGMRVKTSLTFSGRIIICGHKFEKKNSFSIQFLSILKKLIIFANIVHERKVHE